MMGQTPMRATLLATPVNVPGGKVSFVVANTGALVHELVILPLPADGPGTRPTRLRWQDRRVPEPGGGVPVMRGWCRRRHCSGEHRMDHGDVEARSIRVGLRPAVALRRRNVRRSHGDLTFLVASPSVRWATDPAPGGTFDGCLVLPTR